MDAQTVRDVFLNMVMLIFLQSDNYLLSFDLNYLFWFYNSLLYKSALSSLSLKQIVILPCCVTFRPSVLVVTCPEPDVPEDGYVVGYDFNIHSTIEYHCESGYQLVGKNMLECSAQGEWNDEPPTCQCKCFNPSFPWVFNVQHVKWRQQNLEFQIQHNILIFMFLSFKIVLCNLIFILREWNSPTQILF